MLDVSEILLSKMIECKIKNVYNDPSYFRPLNGNMLGAWKHENTHNLKNYFICFSQFSKWTASFKSSKQTSVPGIY